jgi:hypothetical protein
VTLADRLRELAERLPPGGSLTQAGLLELAAMADGHADQATAAGDFRVTDLAARFHRSASTIRDWCEHACFEGAYKLNGRDWRIPHAAVDAFVARQRGGTPGAQLGAWRAVRSARVTAGR